MCQHCYPPFICSIIQRRTSSILSIVFSLVGSIKYQSRIPLGAQKHTTIQVSLISINQKVKLLFVTPTYGWIPAVSNGVRQSISSLVQDDPSQ